MVKSNLKSNINYPEIKTLDEDDRNIEVSLYEIDLQNVTLNIALGNIKYLFEKENIVYYPVYVIKDDNVSNQIGVYELMQDNLQLNLDDDGDLDIASIEGPLLYSFVDQSYLKRFEIEPEEFKSDIQEDKETENDPEDIKDEDDDEKDDDEKDDDEKDDDEKEISNPNIITEQNSATAKEESKDYVETENDNWMQKHMKNSNYDIIENEGGGDCLFASIRDGLRYVNIDKSVSEMRKMLSEEATEEILQTYSELYNFALIENDSITSDIKRMVSEFKTLKKKIPDETEKTRQSKMISEAEKISKSHKELVLKRNEVKGMLGEFEFMKGITTLEALKAKIQTSDYWADTWSISTLERVLKIKLILFSKANYNDGEIDNILTCGQLNDNILETEGIFEPKYYILLNYLGNHYELITYKKLGSLTFKEIPHDVKKLIVNKCMERAAGPYYIIPDFKEYMDKLNVVINDEVDTNTELYDDSTVFQFYFKSADGPKPGKGTGEKLGPEGPQEYIDLSSIPKWRKKLSNFWEQEFILDNKKWLTVEHYYQGSKYKRNNPEHYNLFSLNSNSEVARDPKKARELGSKKKISIDNDFFNGRHEKVLEDGMHAKFTQNKDLTNLLKLTKRAKLQLFIKGSEPIVYNYLMKIRSEI
tara:strand:+ start:2738 stop:4675 length:1938 start_codon:yes stop_codon:yes gene_type:complete